jgi:hypothetical protein
VLGDVKEPWGPTTRSVPLAAQPYQNNLLIHPLRHICFWTVFNQ